MLAARRSMAAYRCHLEKQSLAREQHVKVLVKAQFPCQGRSPPAFDGVLDIFQDVPSSLGWATSYLGIAAFRKKARSQMPFAQYHVESKAWRAL